MKVSIFYWSFAIICLALFSNNLIASNRYENKFKSQNSLTQSDSITLPVQLIYFYAQTQSSYILLKWGTATEVNNFGFEIERAYNSPEAFEVIDFVLGNGTSNIPIDYTYLDTTINQAGIFYYRLKQIDIVGGFEYSDTVEVNLISSINLEKSDIPTSFTISDNFPNPFNPSTKINFQIPFQQFLKINLYDINGKLVREITSKEFLPGSYQLFLDFSNYSSGIYFVSFESSKSVFTKRLTFIK